MIASLQSICQAQIIKVLEQRQFDGRLVNDLCKFVPDILLEPIFSVVLEKGVITDTALLAFLVPSRLTLKIHSARSIRNSTFKQIGLNCPDLVRYFCVVGVAVCVCLTVDFFFCFPLIGDAGFVQLRASQ
jgi:hypothetical protein